MEDHTALYCHYYYVAFQFLLIFLGICLMDLVEMQNSYPILLVLTKIHSTITLEIVFQ